MGDKCLHSAGTNLEDSSVLLAGWLLEAGGFRSTLVVLRGGRIDNINVHTIQRLQKQWYRTNPGTKAEPQQIVAQRLLSCLQYLVPFKSSTEDLTRPTFGSVVKYCVDQKAIGTKTPVKVNIVAASMDSDLEAFSHNPTDDSFGALAVQPTPLPNIRTNGSSRTKLDYCRDNQLISRVKLTCLTTV